ncbi:MAG: META domain-containing protein [Bacteroides sp.]|nr:META domain-containing protein [Lachnospiraceae bacterium]MCM1332584.1 META domain-containing protein [Bacteroides sp.]MCM1390929.1 META domain-containing protein [Bacteroides sp.]
MNKTVLIAAMSAIVVGLSSCGSLKKSNSTAVKVENNMEESQEEKSDIVPYSMDDLAGEWTISSVGGHKVTGENRPYVNFSLEDGRIYGSNGCNIINGGLVVKGNNMSFDKVISTMMACADAPYEQAINLALENTRTYSISKRGHELYLELKNGSKQTVMVLRKHNMDFLNGTWHIEEIDGQKYNLPDMQMVLDVQELRLHGNTGCNLVNGSLIIDPDKSNSIQFNNLASTRMMCDPESMKAETACLVALESVEYAKKGRHDTVQLFDKDNKVVMVIKKVEVEK